MRWSTDSTANMAASGRHLRALGERARRARDVAHRGDVVRRVDRALLLQAVRALEALGTKVGITMPSVYARSDMVAKSSRCTFVCSASASATHAVNAPHAA